MSSLGVVLDANVPLNTPPAAVPTSRPERFSPAARD